MELLNTMLSTVRKLGANLVPRAREEDDIAKEGHREYVGGMWDEVGQL